MHSVVIDLGRTTSVASLFVSVFFFVEKKVLTFEKKLSLHFFLRPFDYFPLVSFFFLISLLHLFFKKKSIAETSPFLLFLCFSWDEHPFTTIFTPTTPWPMELFDSLVTVLGECGDDTRKSRSVIKFVYLPTLTRLFLLVGDASRRLGCFSPCLCHTLDVADRSELIVARNVQSLFICLCTIHAPVSRLRPRSEFVPSCACQIPCCPQHVVLNTSVSWHDRLCDAHCELLDQWTILTSQKVIASQSSSARVIIYIIVLFFSLRSKSTIYGMSGTEGQDPGGTAPIHLQLPRGATGNSREQSTPQSTAPVTRLIDTESLLQVPPYQGDYDHVFFSWFFSFFVPFL